MSGYSASMIMMDEFPSEQRSSLEKLVSKKEVPHIFDDELLHYGVKGMKWGIRKERVFVSGTSKMQNESSAYYRKELPKDVTKQLDDMMKTKSTVLVGDCVGADDMVQKYLAKHNYKNVEIYVTGENVRHNADKDGKLGWKVNHIDGSKYEPDSKEWHAVKDIAMHDASTSGLSIILDNNGAKATRRNIDRMLDDGREVYIYELSSSGAKDDGRRAVDEYLNEPVLTHSYDELFHYGTPRRSGRYPYGSGKDPYQHSDDFLGRVQQLRNENFTYTDEDGKHYTGDMAIAKSMGLNSTQFRVQLSLAKDERRMLQVSTAEGLRDKGYSLNQIAEKMGFANDSSVRSLLNERSKNRMNQARTTANFLKEQVDAKGMIDVGSGVEKNAYLGNVSREKMEEALYILQLQGYEVYGGRVPQVTNPGKDTTIKVLCPPGTKHNEIYDFSRVHSLEELGYVSHDDGETFDPKWVYPKSLDPSRVKVRYAEEGGIDKDGVVEIRRGVEDVSLGESTYSQVRVLVGGTHYIKGMAVYGDDKDFPPGVDMIFNTNKAKGTPMLGEGKKTVLKHIKDDPDNPFGSLIKEGIYDPDNVTEDAGKKDSDIGGQSYYYDKDGKKQLRVINKRADEGDWDRWANKIPSQMLAKQPVRLINRQLKISETEKQNEFEEICALTNPTVKKVMLQSFANDCDSAAVHLKAAALPRQRYQVILPMTTIGDNEIYAPNFKPGEKVALIRYPHGGTFEIPILTVNNNLPEGKRVLGTHPIDAVGINSKVAERLSGADFDGDTVMVIPTNSKVNIQSTPALKGLKDFDPKMAYPAREGMKEMKNTQTEMGMISNLITDMTLKGADWDELARAVRHSMVVIDAEKHHLDYKQSEIDNDIASLKKLYQGRVDKDGHYREGASTLISQAKSEVSVPRRKGTPKINQKGKPWYDSSKSEGALIYKNAVKNEPGKPWYDSSKPKGSVMYIENHEEYQEMRQAKRQKVDADGNPMYRKNGKPIMEPAFDEHGKPILEKAFNADGTPKMKVRTQPSTKMAETDDARTLISDAHTAKEEAYAAYANKMKALANSARKEMVYTKKIPYNKSANATYSAEVASLTSKLNVALKNAPRERQAQLMANSIVEAKKKSNPDMTKKDIKKESQRALAAARVQMHAHRQAIEITDKEWEAIQAGAIAENRLMKILNNADLDSIRERATPRTAKKELSDAKISNMAALRDAGYSTAEIADKFGISASTVNKYLKGR